MGTGAVVYSYQYRRGRVAGTVSLDDELEAMIYAFKHYTRRGLDEPAIQVAIDIVNYLEGNNE